VTLIALDLRAILDAAERAEARGDHKETERLLREALALQESRLGAQHPEVANVLNNLAVVCEMNGKPDDAEACYRRAYAIAKSRLRADDPFVATSRHNLEEFCQERGIAFDEPSPAADAPLRMTFASDDFGTEDAPIAPIVPPPAKAAPPPPPSHLRPMRDSPWRMPSVDPEPMFGTTPMSTPVPRRESLVNPIALIVLLVVAGGLGIGYWLSRPTSDSPSQAVTAEAPPLATASNQPPAAPPAPTTTSPPEAATPGAAAPAPVTPSSSADRLVGVPAPADAPVPPPTSVPPPASSGATPAPRPASPPPASVSASRTPRVPAPPVDTPSLSSSAGASTGAPIAPSVVTAELCRRLTTGDGQWACEPVSGTVAPGPLYFFTRVASSSDGLVEHRWYHEGVVQQQIPLRIRANPSGYRTYSLTTIRADRTGSWKIEVRTADGKLLHEESFNVQ
jgi:hypothetical protein